MSARSRSWESHWQRRSSRQQHGPPTAVTWGWGVGLTLCQPREWRPREGRRENNIFLWRTTRWRCSAYYRWEIGRLCQKVFILVFHVIKMIENKFVVKSVFFYKKKHCMKKLSSHSWRVLVIGFGCIQARRLN